MKNNFVGLNSQLVFNFDILPCDIFLELVKNNKILKIANANDRLSVEFMTKFHNKTQRFLIEKTELVHVYDKLIDTLNTESRAINPASTQDVYTFLSKYQEMLEIGFKAPMPMASYESLKNLFFDFFVEKDIINNPLYSYMGLSQVIFNKSLLRMVLTLYMAKNIAYIKENCYFNINTVSFFCDISLVEHPNQNHHFLSAKMISKEKNLYNEDVYLGILHHHEYLDGSGLLKLESRRIHEYGNLVRMAEDYIDSEFTMNLHSLDLFNKYSKNNVFALRKITAS